MKKIKKKLSIFAVLAALITLSLTLLACGSASSATDTTASTKEDTSTDTMTDCCGDEEASADELSTLKFGITPGTIRTAIVLLADHLGYYEEEGVHVELVEVSDTTAALTSISTNKSDIDIWGTGIVADLTFIANGSDLVIFEGTAAEGGAIIALPENVDTYKDIANYEGITVATVRADTAWVTGRAYLIEQGIDIDSITVMEVDSQVNVAEAVQKGEADLGFLPAEYANKYADSVEIVYEVGELVPNYVCCRQVTSRTTLEEKQEELIRFTIANLRALEYYNDEANRDEIVAFLADYSEQTEEYVYNYLFENRTIMTLDPNKDGIALYYNSLVDAGYFEGYVDIEEHVDTSIYDTAVERLAARE